MHLLQAGVDITVIALWLGHESTQTTHGYIEADLALKEKALKTVFSSAYVDRGWFAFLPFTGEPYFFGANSQMKGFDWGTLSNPTGVVFAEEKKEEPAKKSSLNFLNRKKASVEPEPEVKPVNDPAPKLPAPTEPEVKPPGTDTAIVWTKVKVPPQLQGGVKNAWIRLFFGDRAQGLVSGSGELPGDHQSKNCEIDVHPSLVPFTKLPVSDTKSMKVLYEKVIKGVSADVVQFKSTTREPATNYTIAMTEEEKTKTMEKLIKFLDAAAKKRPSPLELQKEAAKRPPFSEQFGIDRNELLLRSENEYLDICEGNRVAVDIIKELQHWLIQASGVDLEKVAAGTKGDEPKVTKVGEQVAVPPASSEPAPAKKSSLGFLRGKKSA